MKRGKAGTAARLSGRAQIPGNAMIRLNKNDRSRLLLQSPVFGRPVGTASIQAAFMLRRLSKEGPRQVAFARTGSGEIGVSSATHLRPAAGVPTPTSAMR